MLAILENASRLIRCLYDLRLRTLNDLKGLLNRCTSFAGRIKVGARYMSRRSEAGGSLEPRPIIPQTVFQRALRSFDKLIGGDQQLCGDSQTHRPRSLEINNELEFGRIFDRQLTWLCTA
jgi:hypothetical protein